MIDFEISKLLFDVIQNGVLIRIYFIHVKTEQKTHPKV